MSRRAAAAQPAPRVLSADGARLPAGSQVTQIFSISFDAPRFLYLLLLLPMAVFVLWIIRVRVETVRSQLSEGGRTGSAFLYARLTICFLLGCSGLIVALAQPQLEQRRSVPVYRKVNLVFLLDTSLSMRARDISPSRLERASSEIGNLLQGGFEDIAGVGLVSFSGSSVILSYLTRDPSNILFYLDHLETDSRLTYGTDIGSAIRNALSLIDKEQELEESLRTEDFLLILISDGEDHGGLLRQMVVESADRGVRIYCLGLGSRAGGYIPVGERRGQTRFLVDEQGQRVLATFKEDTLRGIAARTGGRYYRSSSGAELRDNLREILAAERVVVATRNVHDSRPVYFWFLVAGFLGIAAFLVK